MSILFGGPSFAYFSIIFIICLVIYNSITKVKRLSKWVSWSFVIILFSLAAVDYNNYQYTKDKDRVVRDFPYYEKLEFNQQISYLRCLISLGPVSLPVCKRLFDGSESLKIPTKFNLNDRLKTCHFDKLNWQPQSMDELEHDQICAKTLREIEKNGSYEKKIAVFNIILKRNKRGKDCGERLNHIGPLRVLESLREMRVKYEMEECLKNKCYLFCGAIDETRFGLKSTKMLKDDFVDYRGQRYYAERFIVSLMRVILINYYRSREQKLVFEKIGWRQILVAYQAAGKLEHLISLVEKSLKTEIPEESKDFDINLLMDLEKIEKVKIRMETPPI